MNAFDGGGREGEKWGEGEGEKGGRERKEEVQGDREERREEGEGGGKPSNLNSHLTELIRSRYAGESRPAVEETHKAKV